MAPAGSIYFYHTKPSNDYQPNEDRISSPAERQPTYEYRFIGEQARQPQRIRSAGSVSGLAMPPMPPPRIKEQGLLLCPVCLST
jgi:hypothetical protein